MDEKRTAAAIFLLALLAFAALAPQDPGNAQVVTRLGLTLSILDHGDLTIDRYADRTIDKALVDGHYFADKVPGHSLLAVPAAAMAKLLMPPGADPVTDPEIFARYAYLVTLGTNGLLSAIAAALVFLTAQRLGASQRAAAFGSVGLALATPFLGWSTAFFGHSVSASLLLFAVALAVFGFAGPAPWREHRPVALGLGLGMLMGFVLVVDLTVAPLVAMGGLLLAGLALRSGIRPALPFLVAIGAGGLIGLAPLPLYNWLAFGDPLKLGYSGVVGFEGMREGLFGITVPDPAVAGELLFGLYRGLLPLSPLLLLAPLGLWRLALTATGRPLAGFIALSFVALLLINAAYHYWNGGWSMGPRHLVPALPLLGLALAFAWPRSFWGSAVAGFLLSMSAVTSALAAAGGMFPPEQYRVPLLEFALPNIAAAPDAPLRLALLAAAWAVALFILFRPQRLPDAGLSRPRVETLPH